MPDSTDATRDEGYVPALRYRFLTRFYDRVLASTLKEEKLKGILVEQAALRAGQRALDLGCGTATLTIMLKESEPRASVCGLDGDAEALEIARRKIRARGLDIELVEAMSYSPPEEAGSFDRIVSSLLFHHLTSEQKRRTLASCARLLGPRGELHIADWGKAQNALMRTAFLAVQLLDGFETTQDNVNGELPTLMSEAGFVDVEETHREPTLFGTLSLYRAVVS